MTKAYMMGFSKVASLLKLTPEGLIKVAEAADQNKVTPKYETYGWSHRGTPELTANGTGMMPRYNDEAEPKAIPSYYPELENASFIESLATPHFDEKREFGHNVEHLKDFDVEANTNAQRNKYWSADSRAIWDGDPIMQNYFKAVRDATTYANEPLIRNYDNSSDRNSYIPNSLLKRRDARFHDYMASPLGTGTTWRVRSPVTLQYGPKSR